MDKESDREDDEKMDGVMKERGPISQCKLSEKQVTCLLFLFSNFFLIFLS